MPGGEGGTIARWRDPSLIQEGAAPSGGGVSRASTSGGTVNTGPSVNPNYQYNANALAGLMKGLDKPLPNAPAAPKYTSSIAVNPMQQEAYGATKNAYGATQAATAGATKFAESLADRSHESITNAMQRGRDTTAMALSDVRAGAGMRGGGPGSGLSGVLQTRAALAGNRQNQALNAQLTDVALGREGEARRGVTDAAQGQVSGAGTQAGAAAQAAADQRARDEAAQGMFRWSSDYSQRQAEGDRSNKNYLIEMALRSNTNPWSGV